MKAVIVDAFGPVDGADYREVPDPEPGPGEVVVDVHAAEVNFPDILVMEGAYQFKPPLPFSPGKAAAGIVSAVGDGVREPRVGTRVSAQVEYGAYAGRMRAPAANCYTIPDAMPFETAAALGLVYQTSHFALVERARLRAGERVLVLGASGGIGYSACQLARALNAGQVIGAVRGADDAAVAAEAGCDQVIEIGGDTGELRERLRDRVRALTDGAGVDVVIDPVGGEAFGAALRALAWRGRLVVVGFASGAIPEVRANYLLVKNIEVSGLQWSDYRERDPAWTARVQGDIFRLWNDGKLAPMISETAPMADFAAALARLRRGQVQGKIVLLAEH